MGGEEDGTGSVGVGSAAVVPASTLACSGQTSDCYSAVSALPFPAAELAFATGHGNYGDNIIAFLLHAAVSSATGVAVLELFSYLNRHPEPLRPEVPDGFFRGELWRAVFEIFTPGVPVLVGFISTTGALALMDVLPVFDIASANGLRRNRQPTP